jgi:FkbM family methyltransferase
MTAAEPSTPSSATQLISYAQHGEDIVLWRALRTTAGGTYVDVGAYHPTDDSVTRLFYERGWRGLNIDPTRASIELFDELRPDDTNLCLAAGDVDGEIDFFVPDTPGWSTTNPVVGRGLQELSGAVRHSRVPVRRLSTLLREYGLPRVDFLKIDAEGAESAVVAGLDLDEHRPRVIVLEGVAPVVGSDHIGPALSMLEQHNYSVAGFDGLNYYLTGEPELAELLHAPANPTDEFIRYDVLRLQEHIAMLTEQMAQLSEQNAGLVDALAQASHALRVFEEREPEIRALEAWAASLSRQIQDAQ